LTLKKETGYKAPKNRTQSISVTGMRSEITGVKISNENSNKSKCKKTFIRDKAFIEAFRTQEFLRKRTILIKMFVNANMKLVFHIKRRI
jgi:hypothetical protein